MKHLLDHLIQRHVIPLLLIPVVLSGMACFAICGLPQAIHSSATTDEIILVVFSLLGVIGTICTSIILRLIRSKPPTWQVCALGRAAWMALVTIAWLVGVACGAVMTHDISR